MHATTIHLIPNAHLDPVWFWDWREGLNEGIATCRAVLDLMDEFPELTFIRGEAAIYEHIEQHDPATFARPGGDLAERACNEVPLQGGMKGWVHGTDSHPNFRDCPCP